MTVVKNGKKLYPVGNRMKHQHKLYNYNDICYNHMMDHPEDESAEEAYDESNHLLDVWNFGVMRDGMVYAEYKDYAKIKDIIGAYDLRH